MKDLRMFRKEIRNKFVTNVESDIDKIISHIRSIKGKLRITVMPLDDDDFIEINESPEQAKSYELTENGVSFLAYSDEIFNLLKEYINSDIIELEMPVSSLCDSNFLKRMDNLKTIYIGEGDTLSVESLEEIVENSSVSNIVASRLTNFHNRDAIVLSNASFCGREEVVSAKYNDVLIKGCVSNDFDLSLAMGSVEDFEEAWNFFIQECSDKSELELKCYDESQPNENEFISLRFRDGKIYRVDIKMDDALTVTNILPIIDEYFNNDTEVKVHVENKTYEGVDKAAEVLKKYNSEILYPAFRYSSYEENTDVDGFEYIRGTMDYYKGLINEYNLSPYERLVYAYDLIKSYYYQDYDEDKSKSRNIPDIIRDGYIVCAGYAAFLNQLLSELGFGSSVLVLDVNVNGETPGHARNILYLKDEKYGIDGVYSLDATYDSRCDNLSLVLDSEGERIKKRPKDSDTILKRYDSTALFCDFLVPYSEYSLTYATERNNKYESLPDFIDSVGKVDSLDEDGMSCLTGFTKSLFGDDCDVNECINIVKNSPVVPNDKLRSALEVVKRCQGYTDEEIKPFVDDVIEIREINDAYIRNTAKKSNVAGDEKSY